MPNTYPNFAHIKQVMDIELNKPIKIAHKLTDKVVSPLSLEKTNVSPAEAVFHDSTITALNKYGNEGLPSFLQTAEFLVRFRDWWDRFNVKSKDKGYHNSKETMRSQSIKKMLKTLHLAWTNLPLGSLGGATLTRTFVFLCQRIKR